MPQIVIIGAGLTGLSTAYHLEQLGFFDYILLEKESEIGGLCRSIQQDGFTFDYTGHLLHISDSYFKQFIADIIGFESLLPIERRSYVYTHNTYVPYPFQMNLYGLPQNVIDECINGFIHKQTCTKENISFYDWAHSTFGSGIAHYFFEPYQSKIFATDIKNITASWTGRFVPKTTLKEIKEGALKPRKNSSIGYNAHFFLPQKRWHHQLD